MIKYLLRLRDNGDIRNDTFDYLVKKITAEFMIRLQKGTFCRRIIYQRNLGAIAMFNVSTWLDMMLVCKYELLFPCPLKQGPKDHKEVLC